jgi:hypothetical protein
MAALAHAIQNQFGDYVADTEWLGFGLFKNLLAELDLDPLKIALVGPSYVYDPARHQVPSSVTPQRIEGEIRPPATQSPALDALSRAHPSLAPLAMKVHDLTETPYLKPEHYALMLQEIAREINENHSYHMTRTSKTVRDRCVEKGAPVARAHVNFVLIGISRTGHSLGAHLPEEPSELGKCLVQNTINLCRFAQFNPTDQEIDAIREWMVGALK